jgi:hypothetical protein
VRVGVVERSAFADAERERRAHVDPAALRLVHGRQPVRTSRTRARRTPRQFFARAERHRKKPWRMVAALGPTLAIEYLAGTLDLESACSRSRSSAGADDPPVLLEEAARRDRRRQGRRSRARGEDPRGRRRGLTA